MRTTEAMRRMLEQSGKGAVTVSKEIGRDRSYLTSTLNRGNIPSASALAQVARACGYKLVLESDTDRIDIDPE